MTTLLPMRYTSVFCYCRSRRVQLYLLLHHCRNAQRKGNPSIDRPSWLGRRLELRETITLILKFRMSVIDQNHTFSTIPDAYVSTLCITRSTSYNGSVADIDKRTEMQTIHAWMFVLDMAFGDKLEVFVVYFPFLDFVAWSASQGHPGADSSAGPEPLCRWCLSRKSGRIFPIWDHILYDEPSIRILFFRRFPLLELHGPEVECNKRYRLLVRTWRKPKCRRFSNIPRVGNLKRLYCTVLSALTLCFERRCIAAALTFSFGSSKRWSFSFATDFFGFLCVPIPY